MHVILAYVSSLDGRITRGNSQNVREWTSDEDNAHLKTLIANCDALIIGRTTYEAVRPKATSHHRIIVMTSTPDRFADDVVPGQREFVADDPSALLARLSAEGCSRILLLGGPHMATAFLQQHLIGTLAITIEPYIFGAGMPFTDPILLDIPLELQDTKPLNQRGTLVLNYRILRG